MGALLIESAFSVSSRTGWLTTAVRQARTETTGVFPSITPQMREHLGGDDPPELANLESIRVRYRMSDVTSADARIEFPLGLHVLAEEKLGITLQSMSRLGSEGIFDVAILWAGEFEAYAGSHVPRGSMPPVVLLT